MGTRIFSYRAESRARGREKPLDDDPHAIEGVRMVRIGPHEHESVTYEIGDGKTADKRALKKGARS